MDVGFIGIGSMGAAMVPNLVKAGHRVGVWKRTAAMAKSLKGVTTLPSPAAAFENDAVVTMLSDDTAVRRVIIDTGALASARTGCVHVVMATISLALVDELEELRRRSEVAYVAAPGFGIPAVAAQGELMILAAGHPADRSHLRIRGPRGRHRPRVATSPVGAVAPRLPGLLRVCRTLSGGEGAGSLMPVLGTLIIRRPGASSRHPGCGAPATVRARGRNGHGDQRFHAAWRDQRRIGLRCPPVHQPKSKIQGD